jgi:hypothetical protein
VKTGIIIHPHFLKKSFLLISCAFSFGIPLTHAVLGGPGNGKDPVECELVGFPANVEVSFVQPFKKSIPLKLRIKNNTDHEIVLVRWAVDICVSDSNGNMLSGEAGEGTQADTKADFFPIRPTEGVDIPYDCVMSFDGTALSLGANISGHYWWAPNLPLGKFKLTLVYELSQQLATSVSKERDLLDENERTHLFVGKLTPSPIEFQVVKKL